MKHLNILLALVLTLAISSNVKSQDIHFSQYEKAPTLVNPAFAGHFKGSYRINGVYRFQNFSTGKYNTLALTVDVPVFRGLRKQDWIGAGLMLSADRSGVITKPGLDKDVNGVAQKISLMGYNVAYHIANKKQTQIISIGAQYLNGNLSYENGLTESNFASGLLGNISNIAKHYMSQQNQDNLSSSKSNLSVGLMFNNRSKTSDFKIGLSVNGLLAPKAQAITNSTDGGGRLSEGDGFKRGLGINGVLSYNHAISKQMSFTHGLFYYGQGNAMAINVNSKIHYQLNLEKDFTLIAGLGTRTLQSAILYLGAETGPFQFGLSYDFDISSSTPLTNTLNKGVELGVTYLGVLSKKPKLKPVIYCPRI